jgi:hypothetical protein
MVGHQHVGMDGDIISLRRILQIAHIPMVIVDGKKAGFAIVAALDNMLRNAGQIEARFACH